VSLFLFHSRPDGNEGEKKEKGRAKTRKEKKKEGRRGRGGMTPETCWSIFIFSDF